MQTTDETPYNPKDNGSVKIQGHIKIFDPVSNEVFVDKRNAIHYENFSIALANSISNAGKGFISEMAFGNGGSRIDPVGLITYLTPNTVGRNATLYNQTYYKVVDANNPFDKDPTRNFMEVRHVAGTAYSDVLVSCLLDFGEPNGQAAFDNSMSQDGSYVFDELGLRGYSPDGEGTGPLLTHVIFHPVQKSLNRLIQIDYTVRIQSLSNGI
ncbi:MAG: hypothetical protein ACMV1B_04670 [Prevotella sp.]